MIEVKREKEEYKDRQWRWAEPVGPIGHGLYIGFHAQGSGQGDS